MSPSLIKSIDHFISFDYSKVYIEAAYESIFRFFVVPYVPFIFVLCYLLFSKPLCQIVRDSLKLQSKGGILDKFVTIHSAVLAVYSAWTCYYSWNIVYNFMIENENSLNRALCDVDGTLWIDKGFSFWVLHFYVSKFYEFLDTWIIILKGKKVSFLQEFHHAGIAISMWGFYVSSASVVLIIVCFNSFIHTVMYTYYTAASFGYRSPLKNYLTMAQITQFIIGMTITVPTHFYPNCLSSSQSFVLFMTQIYTVILIVLFVWFYKDEYSKKKPKAI